MIPPNDSTARALFRAVLENPDQDQPRLLYADRLEELGNERMECPDCTEGGGLHHFAVDNRCLRCEGVGHILDYTNQAHAELIRGQISGEIREEESLSAGFVGPRFRGNNGGVMLRMADPLADVAYTVRRGFVDEISLTLARFLALFGPHNVSVAAGGHRLTEPMPPEYFREKYPWPLTKIRLTDRRPVYHMTRRYFWRDSSRESFGSEGLPKILYDKLNKSPLWWYPSDIDALDDLSRACVAHFRSVCGISIKTESRL